MLNAKTWLKGVLFSPISVTKIALIYCVSACLSCQNTSANKQTKMNKTLVCTNCGKSDTMFAKWDNKKWCKTCWTSLAINKPPVAFNMTISVLEDQTITIDLRKQKVVATNPIMGDFDNDCDVDLTDLSFHLSVFGKPASSYNEGDITGDHVVSIDDLAITLRNFGLNCGNRQNQ